MTRHSAVATVLVGRAAPSAPLDEAVLFRELDSWLGTPWGKLTTPSGFKRAEKGVGGECDSILWTAARAIGLLLPPIPNQTMFPGLATEDEVPLTIEKYFRELCRNGQASRQLCSARRKL
jgi:hypothetical protein